jgi:hypothetical protein
MQQARIHMNILTFFALAKEILAGKETEMFFNLGQPLCGSLPLTPRG